MATALATTVDTTSGTTPDTSTGTAPGSTTVATHSTPATQTSNTTLAAGPLTAASVAFNKVATVTGALDVAQRTGDTAIYIVSQSGTITALRPGKQPTVVFTFDASRLSVGGERGLLGLAFSPDGSMAYTDSTNADGKTEITEFVVDQDGVIDPASARLLLSIDQPYPNHNGGGLRFGPDGYLYIGMGDGGLADDPERRGLDNGELLGKLLRIDPTPSADLPYTIPADNPFVGVDGARGEIWSSGLRNPWRFNFDLETNDLWIADVGQNAWEEIDFAPASAGAGKAVNFGWSAFEGTHRFNEDQAAQDAVAPFHEYPHGDLGCSISGGVRYRGTAIPALVGWYVYADYCSGQVRAIQVADDGTEGAEITFEQNVAAVSGVAQGLNGELFVTSVDSGTVFALTAAS